MHPIIIEKFKKEPKMLGYLKENSEWIKLLNRDYHNYESFVNKMKDLYHLRTTDKISSAIDSIGTINSVLEVLK